jgi:ADP-ribose pyrophosphatase
MKPPFYEKTLDSQSVFDGKLIQVERLTVELPNGQPAIREIVRHSGAVAVLAFLDEKILMVQQYRKAIDKASWEIPAGKLEPNESPKHCAQRELMEETGYRAETLTQLRFFYTAIGFCDEAMTLFKAEKLEAVDGVSGDDDEFLEVRAFTLEEAQQLIHSGDICDAKTMLAIALCQQGV